MKFDPRNNFPSINTALPTPVPSVNKTILAYSLPAPNFHSPTNAARASFSRMTGTLHSSRAQRLKSNVFASVYLTYSDKTIFSLELIILGKAMPMEVTLRASIPFDSINSRIFWLINSRLNAIVSFAVESTLAAHNTTPS